MKHKKTKVLPLVMLVLTAAVMLPGKAHAQYDPRGNFQSMNSERNGQSKTIDNALQILPDRDTPQQFNAYSEMMDYGRCATKVAAPKLRDALVEKANSATEQRFWADAAVLSQACKGSKFRPTLSLIRGSYAEGMYHAVMAAGLPYGPLQPSDPGYTNFLAREKEHNLNLDKNDQVMSNATNCMVASQPGVADAVLSTRHGSPDEAKAMDLMFASAPICAGSKRPDRLSRSYLRAYLASSAYRYASFRAPKMIALAK